MRHSPVAMEGNCIVGQKSYNINFFSFYVRNFVPPIIESVRTPARITPYPTGRLFWGGTVPGTSCQATIAPSLRDISQQALVRLERYQPVGYIGYGFFAPATAPAEIKNRGRGRGRVRGRLVSRDGD